MKVKIMSRELAEKQIRDGWPESTAVISFCDPQEGVGNNEAPVDYSNTGARYFRVEMYDMDILGLEVFHMTIESFFPEAPELARFIHQAVEDGLTIICQCDYGRSRSAGCAAAILEYYEGRGLDIFADYRYLPNQLIFNKLLAALRDLPINIL